MLEEQKTALDAQNKPFAGAYLQKICALVCACISDVGYPASHSLWVEIIAESARNPSLKNTYIASDMAMRHGIGNIIRQGVESGEFRRDIGIEETTIILFALIDGLIARKAINKKFSTEKELPSFTDILKRILI